MVMTDIEKLAIAELNQEEIRRLIDEAKERIKSRKRYWFPWKIIFKIERRK